MKEALSIETERMDDIPLLLTHMQRMHLAELLDKHIPTHGQRKGLSVGELSVVWLAHIHTPGRSSDESRARVGNPTAGNLARMRDERPLPAGCDG
jgi:hypothetical protein